MLLIFLLKMRYRKASASLTESSEPIKTKIYHQFVHQLPISAFLAEDPAESDNSKSVVRIPYDRFWLCRLKADIKNTKCDLAAVMIPCLKCTSPSFFYVC